MHDLGLRPPWHSYALPVCSDNLCKRCFIPPMHILIDRVAGEIIRLVASLCVRVCPSVCLWALSCLNRLTFDLYFWPEGRPLPWPWLAWDCSQGRRSKVKVKQWKLYTLSRLNQWCRAGRCWDSACRVQPMVIANDHYQSIVIVCLSVIKGRSTCRA